MKKGDIAMSFLCVLLGFVIALQLRSVTINSAQSSLENIRANELRILLSEEREKNANLYQQLLDYRDSLDKLQNQAASTDDYTQELYSRLKDAEVLAGLSAVEGQGVIVTIKDSPYTSGDPNSDVIHDDDILNIINELRDAGAEALAINDERVLATSEVRCAGSTVSVNNNRYAAPFIIKAIGDAKNLEAALTMRHGVIEALASWGIEANVVRSNKIRIKEYEGTITNKFAVPITTQTQKTEGV